MTKNAFESPVHTFYAHEIIIHFSWVGAQTIICFRVQEKKEKKWEDEETMRTCMPLPL